MSVEHILFFIFGGVSLIGAVSVITFRHPIYSALALIVTFFSQAGLFVLLGAHFVAAVQVIVYAGAIMVLFLFVIMLLNLGTLSLKGALSGKLKGFAIILGILLAIEGVYIAVTTLDNTDTALASSQVAADTTYSISELGELLFTDYLLPFEVTSIILLAALIGVIVLVKRGNQTEN
ncbi:NADH-quinone oxidoreductase subunit J [Candidatus Poribacteria bacterium]|nr:NADH-quinone oxidoreductase subunit J [Candidatus Poribacteria bacterium]